jgi:hypothetical protein
MKKLAVLVASAAMVLVFAAPSFACTGWWCGGSQDSLDISNFGSVRNVLTTKTYTGDNLIGSFFGKVFGAQLTTGTASAVSSVGSEVNTTAIASCDCFDEVEVSNFGSVLNNVYTKSDTGNNTIGGWWTGGVGLTSGSAGATTLLENIVNTTVIGN